MSNISAHLYVALSWRLLHTMHALSPAFQLVLLTTSVLFSIFLEEDKITHLYLLSPQLDTCLNLLQPSATFSVM